MTEGQDASPIFGEYMKIFDTHAHYFDRRFATEYEGGAEVLLQQLMPEPVERIVNVGTNCESSRRAIAQAACYKGMYAAVGIHPEDCHYIDDPNAALAELAEILGDVAIRSLRSVRSVLIITMRITVRYRWTSKNKHSFLRRSYSLPSGWDCL